MGCIDGNGAAGKCTGYEYGLLLYGLTMTDSPLRHELFRIVLDSRDEEGIWAEYYAAGKPEMCIRDRFTADPNAFDAQQIPQTGYNTLLLGFAFILLAAASGILLGAGRTRRIR